MKMIGKIFFIYSVINLIQCSAQIPGSPTMPDAFYKCWIASPEEDIKENSISDTYRPCDFKEFKESFFKKKITFFKNGNCKWLVYAPNNPDSIIDCLWFYKGGKISLKNNKKETLFKFTITHLAGNRMNIVVK